MFILLLNLRQKNYRLLLLLKEGDRIALHLQGREPELDAGS